ncbi:MAG: NAD(P)/FAD-dependent oxidoreductase [Acidiferrobacterales bacterium]
MRRQWDVVIVGGGVIGSSSAYFLAASTVFTGSVLVVEKDRTYRDCSTARSVGGIRQQFSTPENIEISKFAAHFVKHVDEYLSVDGEAPVLFFMENGYLFLASQAGLPTLEANHRTQGAHGVNTTRLTRNELSQQFPWLNVDDLAAGSLGEKNEGWVDPYALLQGFRRKARQLGAVYVEDEVIALTRQGARITDLRLQSAGDVSCGTVVNAAGPRAREVAAMAPLKLAVHPRKRQVYVFSCKDGPSRCPLVIDTSGMYFRPEGAQFICGISPDEENDPDCLDLEVDYGPFETKIWPLLAHRVPAFEAIKLTNAWAGHYAYNPFDKNVFLGPHPDCENFLLANGFSGHGLQQSPAVGRAISELIAFGEYRTLDLSRFSYQRYAANKPIVEANVV